MQDDRGLVPDGDYGRRHGGVLDRAARALVRHVRPMLDSRERASSRSFSGPEIMRPHLHSKLWGWTHFGAFIPDLPEPYRFVNTMTFVGSPGVMAFDNGEFAAADVRNNATVLSSTAHGDMYFYRAFDGVDDCEFASDGSVLRFGDALTWRADHPTYTVSGSYGSFSTDIELTATAHVSYFVKTPVYQHFSILAPYRGTVRNGDTEISVEGLGTVEYARCVSPQVLSPRPVGPRIRIPVDFFTYQVVRIDETTQLLLTDVRAAGESACLTAHVRSTDGAADVIERGTTLEVLAYRDELATDPEGRHMRVPDRMRWTVPGYGVLEAVVDDPLRYGHGLGYVGSYRYEGRWQGRPVTGTGYFEWVDLLDR